MSRAVEHQRSFEPAPRAVDVFAVLDMDRTLLNTTKVTERLCRQLERHGISTDQVDSDIAFIRRQEGQSFSLLDFLEAQYGPELFSVVKQEVQEGVELGVDTEGLLCDGTIELLEELDKAEVPFAVLTFGEQANQDFKIALLRNLVGRGTNDLHATVTSMGNKAAWIADTWVHEHGLLVPASVYGNQRLLASQVVIIDDKVSNLESPRQDIAGILVSNTDGAINSTSQIARMLGRGMSLQTVASTWNAGEIKDLIDKT